MERKLYRSTEKNFKKIFSLPGYDGSPYIIQDQTETACLVGQRGCPVSPV